MSGSRPSAVAAFVLVVGLILNWCGCTCWKSRRGTDMKPVAELVRFARWSPDGAALKIGPTTYQSFPIPRRDPAGLELVFIFCNIRPEQGVGSHMTAPTHVARVNASTSALVELRSITPAELLGGHVPGQEIGTHRMPPGLTLETFNVAEGQLFHDYDAVLPYFANGTKPLPSEVLPAARGLRTLFAQLSEPPLAPYYRAFGAEFFAWLESVAV